MARRRSSIKGGGKLRRLLQRLPREVTEPVRSALEDAADELEFEMISRASDDKDLAQSIAKLKRSNGFRWKVGFAKSQKRKWRLAGWRSHFREFGTRASGKHPGVGARPVVRPSVLKVFPLVIPDIEDAVSQSLRRFSRGKR